jgi:hypothetical protein
MRMGEINDGSVVEGSSRTSHRLSGAIRAADVDLGVAGGDAPLEGDPATVGRPRG